MTVPTLQVAKLSVAILNKIDKLEDDPLIKAAALKVAAEAYRQSATAFTTAQVAKGIMENVKK